MHVLSYSSIEVFYLNCMRSMRGTSVCFVLVCIWALIEHNFFWMAFSWSFERKQISLLNAVSNVFWKLFFSEVNFNSEFLSSRLIYEGDPHYLRLHDCILLWLPFLCSLWRTSYSPGWILLWYPSILHDMPLILVFTCWIVYTVMKHL